MRPTPFHLLQIFHADRPLIVESNKEMGIPFLLYLLFVEGTELREDPNGLGRKKYLEQELSDIVIFSMAILDISMSYTTLGFYSKQENMLPEKKMLVVGAQNIDAMISSLFAMLNKVCSSSEYSNLDQELLEIIAFTMMILEFLMGDSDLAIREKLARNTVKYQAQEFKIKDGVTYELVMEESKKLFSKRGGDEEFYADF